MNQTSPHTDLPLILAGPLVRRVTPDSFALWLVAARSCKLSLRLKQGENLLYDQLLQDPELRILQVGARAFVHLIQVHLTTLAQANQLMEYVLYFEAQDRWVSLSELLPDLLYQDQNPRVPVSVQISEVLHGSCRKPHHPSPDALVAADSLVARRFAEKSDPPDLLLMTGDQIYADDLCGPMLLAVHRVIQQLGLYNERFPDAILPDAEALYQAPDTLYGRRAYLPRVLAKYRYSRLFLRSSRPVFTSKACDNHVISFAETFALYLLCWSPALWQGMELPQASTLPLNSEKQALFEAESIQIQAFVAGLPQVRRLLAHLPSYMIFDDHDVTDDWNLTAQWEQAAYGHAFSRRIIGNALMAYWLCQGWGNHPEAFGPAFWAAAQSYCQTPDAVHQDAWIEVLYAFEGWQYQLPTHPKLVVLDTRTRRWHAENPNRPSGLMNWEALTEMQQWLLQEDAVILVSAAPILGVKLIEVLQALLTQLGQALAVDAENWMAHPGAASTLLNIFQHARSPAHFVILSGDVHYSFAYDIRLRFRRRSPKIWQITASGIKNEFPARMLQGLEKLNRVLFHRHSPLNWLTRRKGFKIVPRLANGRSGDEIVNHSGIGLVRLAANGSPQNIQLLLGQGQLIDFEPKREEMASEL